LTREYQAFSQEQDKHFQLEENQRTINVADECQEKLSNE